MEDLGRLSYRDAYDVQVDRHQRVLDARAAGGAVVGTLLLVEHDPVITVSRRPGAEAHLVATPETLREAGVEVERTDRGGDITYHGPGQLVAYPIIDLNRLSLRLHDYMRLLEGAAIRTCAEFGIRATRDPGATGVWVDRDDTSAKICALGVRVRRWITMHGLAINVTTNLEHFKLIVPCGLTRPVTSFADLLGDEAPDMEQVKAALVGALREGLEARVAEREGRQTT